MNPKFKELYSYLKSEGLTDLDENSFYNKYSDPNKAKEIYSYLKSNQMTDLDESSFHAAYFGGKKKEPTVLPSGQDQKPSSSVTAPPKIGPITSLSESSSSTPKGKDDGFYTYSGRKDAVYKKEGGKWFVNPTGKGKFVELNDPDGKRSSVLEAQAVRTELKGKSTDQKIKDIEDLKELSDLETAQALGWSVDDLKKATQGTKVNKIKATGATVTPDVISGDSSIDVQANSIAKARLELGSNASQEKINERAKYHENVNVQKYLKTKGFDVDINGDIDSDKTRYALDILKAKDELLAKEQEDRSKFLSEINNTITEDMLSSQDNIEKLRSEFSKYGYVFQSFGGGIAGKGVGSGRFISVKYNLGFGTETREETFDKNDPELVQKMRMFMAQTFMSKSERSQITDGDVPEDEIGRFEYMSSLIDKMASNPSKYGSTLVSGDLFTNHMKSTYNYIKDEQMSISLRYDDLKNKIDKFKANPTDADREAINNELHELSVRELKINGYIEKAKEAEKNFASISAAYAIEMEKKGGFFTGLSAQFSKGFTSIPKMLLNTSADILPYVVDAVDPITKNRLKNEGYSDSQIADYASKQLKNTVVKEINKGVVNVGSLGQTTQEYLQSEDRGVLESTLGFLAESIGASLSGGGSGALTKLAFFSQSYNSMSDQMLGPEFDALTESEKKLISVPYALVIGGLERLGFKFTSSTSKNPLLNKIINNTIARTFSSIPKDASIDTINRAISESLVATMAQAGLRISGGSIVEGAVEGTQQLAEISIKNIANKIIGKDENGFDFFQDVPDITTADGINEAFKLASIDAAYGALGGFIMSSGENALSSVRNYGMRKGQDKEFSTMRATLLDSKLRALKDLDIDNKVASGEITKEQADEMKDAMNKATSALNKIPEGLSTERARESYGLLLERDKLEQDIQGKDENLTVVQRERIKEINNELQQISRDAVQEQTAGQVPVQPEATVSEEVERGKPEAEPQVVAEEGQAVIQEEVVEPTEEEIDLESKLAEDLGMIKSETKPRLRVEGIEIPAEEDIDIEIIETNLDKLPKYEVNFETPTLSQDIQVNPIEESKSQVKEGTAETRTIESFEGVPMVVGMSDTLAAGKVVDSVGNTMDVEGGLLYNVLGKNKNAAWAGVTKEGAQTQYDEALELYNNNKNLFDQLWVEGKLPNGHVPMAIMRMADTAINSNEAVFRYLSPLVKSQPEQNQRAALEALKGDINVKKKVSQKATVKSANKLDDFISSNNINTLGQLFDMIVIDANNRAKGDTKNTLSLSERSLLFDLMISQQGIKSASKNTVNALFGSKNDPKAKAFLADTIYNDISEPSMMRTPKGNVVAVVGIDVLNGGVIPVEHGNYGFGPKGQMIALISNPKHGLDVFPEWKAKATRVFKENKKGEIPSEQKIGDEVGGAFFIDKAFRGAKVSMEPSDVELLSAKLRFAFPDVTVSNSKEEFDRVLQEEGIRTKESNGKVILGMTKDGKIYLNPESDSLATPIHEFGHIWIDFLRSKASGKKGDALLSKGLSLVEGTKALQQAIAKYGDNDLAREEALVELIATKGETIINESQKKQFKNWLNALFKYVKNFFVTSEEIFKDKKFNEYLDKMSLDDFINTGLADLFKGEAVSPKFKAKEAGKAAAELRFRVGDSVQNFVNKARDNGYSDSAIRNVLIRNGVTKEDIDAALGKYGKELKEVVAKAKEKYDLSVKQRGNSHKQGVSAALGDLQKSDWYKNADDTQREEAVREIKSFFGERLKKAPSTAKITGKQKDKKVTVSESTALKDQIRLEARAARDAKGDMKAKQTKLIDSINSLKDQGILNVNQVSAMLNRIKRLNLDNPVAVAEFLDYAQRVFERADYQATLTEANKISRRIKKLVKSDKLQASTVAIAKAFSKIDPKYVDDIDAYMEISQTVFDAVKSARVTAEGIDTKTAMDYEMVNEYVESTMKEQEQRKADMMLEVYADMFDGVDTQDMKLEDIIEFVNAMKENPEGVSTEEKVRQTRTFVQKMVEVYKPIVRQILNGTDPFTGDDVVIDQKSADIMTELLGMDLSEMDVRDAIAVVEAMDNFVVNQAVDGLEAVVATQRGIKNAKALRDSGFKARAMSTIGREGGTTGFGRNWVGSIMSLKTASDLIFKGVNSAIKVLKDIGVTAFENGVSAAKKMWTNYINDYEAAFAKKKPNGKNFMDAENIYERGMYAFIKRTVTGDVDAQAKELKRKIKLIKDSVEVLRKHGGNKHKQAADMYEALIDKLGLNEDGVTVADIEQRVDSINKDAVNWWVNTWANHYSDLYDVSLNVYNTKIDKDMFYTPDKYSTLKKEKAEVENAMSQGGGFAMVNGFEYDKKSGVLMPSSKPASMESQRYVDLNFDMNNSKSLKAALVDIKTAASIRQIKGALSSDAWLDIMADKDDRDQFRKKVDNFILRARNKHVSAYDSDIIDALEKASRVWASFGAARALAGVTQPFKQTVPLMFSTIINAGRLNLLTPFASKDANAWIDASGMSIANRGIESQSGIEDANRLLEDALQSGKMKRILLAIENANKIGLKVVLSNPDVWIARSAFISYYKQYMKNNGLDTDIDYTDPSKANQDALDYAQHMVDRQQNVSDSDMAGEFLAAGDAPRKVIRNIFFPFATFVMNQKSRMFSDFATLTSKDSSTQDKLVAARSLGGLSLEIAAYQSLGWTIRAYGIKYLADLLIGDDEEDEKEKEDAEKAFKNQTQYMVTQIVKDVLSPSPALDPFIVSGGDKVMDIVQKEFDVYEADAKKALSLVNEQRKKDKKRQLEGIEAERWIEKYIAENRFKLSDFENESKYGMYSITSSKMAELHDSYVLAYEGKYTVEDNRGNKTTKYVLDKDRDILKKMFPYMVVYNAVGFPSEISSLNRKVETAVKKKGITEGMSDTYNEYLKKTGKKKVNALEEELIRTTKATDKYSAVERVIQKAKLFEKAGKFKDEKTIEKTLKKYKSDEKFREFISELASKK